MQLQKWYQALRSTIPNPPPEPPPPLWRLLIVDGHSPHVAPDVVEAMRDRQVEPLRLPPHSTTPYAALDVACFSPLLRAYQNGLQNWVYNSSGETLTKVMFFPLRARLRTPPTTSVLDSMPPETILYSIVPMWLRRGRVLQLKKQWRRSRRPREQQRSASVVMPKPLAQGQEPPYRGQFCGISW